jgi:hypothetical protein
MSKVLVNVTIGIGDVIHNSNAAARDVSLGFISFISLVFCKSSLKLGIIFGPPL